MWEYLRSLKYNDILKRFGDTPTDYLKGIEKVEKDTLKLATVAGTEPTEVMRKDYFVRSFGKNDLKWFEEVDNNGKNDHSIMGCKEIAKCMNACMLSKVSKAKQELASKHNGYNENNGKRGNVSQGDSNQEDSQKRNNYGGGRYGKKNGNNSCGSYGNHNNCCETNGDRNNRGIVLKLQTLSRFFV